MKRARYLLVIVVIVALSGVCSLSPAEDQPDKFQKEQEASLKSPPEKKAALTLTEGSGNSIGIDLTNSIPVRGVQFTIKGVKMTEVRTTSRTEGFMAKFNEDTGIVILVSTVADKIPPGTGSVVDVIGEMVPGSEVVLSNIMIVDTKKALIK